MPVRLVIPDSPDEQYAARQRRHRLVVGALLALLVAAVVFTILRRRSMEPAAAPPLMQDKPSALTRTPAEESLSQGPVPYRLLVGGFADESQAARAARRLRVDGWRVEVLPPSDSAAKHLVQVGPLSDREAAEEAAKSVRAVTGARVQVVPLR